MVRPPPIALRIRSAAAKARARAVLRQLDESDRLQRRVKWQAAKALVSIREMDAIAQPKLRTLLQSDSRRWNVELRMVTQILRRIAENGVG
jgi:hypothetical protein